MLDQKRIVLILLFTFFCKSGGLQCYHGTRMIDSEGKMFGLVTLITCPPKNICFKGKTIANNFVNSNFGCAFDNLTETERTHLNEECYTDTNSFFKCICNDTDGCNKDAIIM